jgi:hypothetical protein
MNLRQGVCGYRHTLRHPLRGEAVLFLLDGTDNVQCVSHLAWHGEWAE